MRRPPIAIALARRWTLHGLNNGIIFGATLRGVGALPRRVSYAIGKVVTWLAWRLMGETRRAVADNLRAIFPDDSATGARTAGPCDVRRLRA